MYVDYVALTQIYPGHFEVDYQYQIAKGISKNVGNTGLQKIDNQYLKFLPPSQFGKYKTIFHRRNLFCSNITSVERLLNLNHITTEKYFSKL